MGGEPYYYFVTYEPDAGHALASLRQREFEAGRYFPVVDSPMASASAAPGRKHASIDAALEASMETGTRSILDITIVGTEPDYGTAALLDAADLEHFYGTAQPTRAAVEDDMSFLEDVERGQAVYFVVYKDGKPDEILFAGYSYD